MYVYVYIYIYIITYPRAAESGMSSGSRPDQGLSSAAGRSGYFACLGGVSGVHKGGFSKGFSNNNIIMITHKSLTPLY